MRETPYKKRLAEGRAKAQNHCVADDEDAALGPDGNYLSTTGYQQWPKVKKYNYGLVYIVSQKRFGYYDDHESGKALVYFGLPLVSDCYKISYSDLKQPPFQGDCTPL